MRSTSYGATGDPARHCRTHRFALIADLADTCRHYVPFAGADRVQPGACQLRQRVAHVLALDLLQRLADEQLDQQGARLRLGNAARLAVEQQILVKIGAGRAMAADDVVGVDLELRLGVELGVRRQHQHLRHLLAVGLLRVRAHDDLALEHAARVPVEHALEQLAAGALGNRVVDDERRVDVLVAARQEGA